MECRAYSFPFDWLISDLNKTVINSILCDFKNFFNKEDFVHEKGNYFFNTRFEYWVYHDFFGNVPLFFQFYFVKKKFKRRIKRFLRFYKNKKCLYIRYCKNQNEVNYVLNNSDELFNMFSKNGSRLLFIANDDLICPRYFYKVKKDENDTVNRSPLFKNSDLNAYIKNNVLHKKTKKPVIKKIKSRIYKRYIKLLSLFFKSSK